MTFLGKIKKAFIHNLNRLPPIRAIVFESAPDLSDNTKAVYDEMIKRGLNKKYKFYWICFGKIKKDYQKIKNVKYLNSNSFITKYIIKRSMCVICCNRFITSSNRRGFNLYLCHGNPLKNTKSYYVIPKEMNYILASSTEMMGVRASFYGYDLSKFIALGYPRNDALTKERFDLRYFFGNNFHKIIVWYPTVRQFKDGMRTGSKHSIPIIWCEKWVLELNEWAKKFNTLIVLKPHFAQDVENLETLDLSNIVFIDDSFFETNKMSSYQFVGNCDALLTDFSSIYYDYTLCDKPIGLIWEDYDLYKDNPGFAVNMDYMMKGGVKIYNLEDLKAFIKDVSNNVDRLKDERREIRDFANFSADGNNSSRVVDFIVEQLKIR